MKFNSKLKYEIGWGWFAIFPIFYVYAFMILLLSGRYNPIRLLHIFLSNFAVHAVMRSILKSTRELDNSIKVQSEKKCSDIKTAPHDSQKRKVVLTINQNIKNSFAQA